VGSVAPGAKERRKIKRSGWPDTQGKKGRESVGTENRCKPSQGQFIIKKPSHYPGRANKHCIKDRKLGGRFPKSSWEAQKNWAEARGETLKDRGPDSKRIREKKRRVA